METPEPLGSQCNLIRAAIPTQVKTNLTGASLTHQTFSLRVLSVSKRPLLPMTTFRCCQGSTDIGRLSAGLLVKSA